MLPNQPNSGSSGTINTSIIYLSVDIMCYDFALQVPQVHRERKNREKVKKNHCNSLLIYYSKL